MKRRGLLVVVSSPSGGGKGTILKELFRRNENLKMSVSATTRAPRPGEEHGVHYYFITKVEFKTNIENHAMLEYAEYCDNFYGTPKAPVEKWLEEGHDVVLEIEVQGGRQIKKVAPDCVRRAWTSWSRNRGIWQSKQAWFRCVTPWSLTS